VDAAVGEKGGEDGGQQDRRARDGADVSDFRQGQASFLEIDRQEGHEAAHHGKGDEKLCLDVPQRVADSRVPA
jgi:hypothetical protein